MQRGNDSYKKHPHNSTEHGLGKALSVSLMRAPSALVPTRESRAMRVAPPPSNRRGQDTPRKRMRQTPCMSDNSAQAFLWRRHAHEVQEGGLPMAPRAGSPHRRIKLAHVFGALPCDTPMGCLGGLGWADYSYNAPGPPACDHTHQEPTSLDPAGDRRQTLAEPSHCVVRVSDLVFAAQIPCNNRRMGRRPSASGDPPLTCAEKAGRG